MYVITNDGGVGVCNWFLTVLFSDAEKASQAAILYPFIFSFYALVC